MRQMTTPPIVVTIPDYILTAFCLHGFHPFSMNSVVPGGWTIAVETTFYFFAPLLFGFITNWQRALAFLLVTLLILRESIFCLHYLYYDHLIWNDVSESIFKTYTYSWFPNQLPVFACGIVTYFVSQSLPSQFLTKKIGLLLLATAAVLIQAAVGVGAHGFIPIPEQLYFSVGFLFIFLGLKCYPTKVLVNSFTQFLGKISYSGYLVHFAALFICVKICHHYFQTLMILPDLNILTAGGVIVSAHQTTRFILLFITTVMLTIPIAWLTYKFIEAPFISLGSRLVRYCEL
jgi:peptidoglycan/LPS O-acetylase OafA/YrhL